MIRKSILFVSALAFSAPAIAGSEREPAATVEGFSSHQELVSYADLNLRDRADQRALKLRVLHAAERLCIRSEGKFNVDRYMGGKENSCEMRTFRDAELQIDNIVRIAASGGQLPTGTALALAAKPYR